MHNKVQPKLSVIVPVYNTEKYVRRCLNSLLNQTYRNLEIIVVDNGSLGDIKQILHKEYNCFNNIKLCSHEKNRGLYQARITGVENSNGDFIAFLDSDDWVSCDFYRTMIEKAIETDADMIISEYICTDINGKKWNMDFTNHQFINIKLEEEAILEKFFDVNGSDFSWHVVWNKIYRRDLWERCYPSLKTQKENITMCEDVAYSVTFYAHAKKIRNVHGDWIYYFINPDSATKRSNDVEKLEQTLYDIFHAFNYASKVLEHHPKKEKYLHKLAIWRNFIYSVWVQNIKISSISSQHKRQLYKKIALYNDGTVPHKYNHDLDFFNFYFSPVPDCNLVDIKEKIWSSECEYVSFDVFDTLILRPFLYPTDLFHILSKHLNKEIKVTDFIDFSKIRFDAERLAREHISQRKPTYQDITLDEIYEQVQVITGFNLQIIERLKRLEIELEKKYCYVRDTGKQLFEFAKAIGKKVLIISDMYLDKGTVEAILKKNGYEGYENLWVSSDVRKTKARGDLYNHIFKELGIEASQLFHIGDNWDSDVVRPQQLGACSYHLPKPADLLMNLNGNIYSGRFWNDIYESTIGIVNSNSGLNFLGIRCMLGLSANRLFDNPFVCTDPDASIPKTPIFIGYMALGMSLFALCQKLNRLCILEEVNNINFLARDGYLPKKAFEILYGDTFQLNYLAITRKSILPAIINNQYDFLCLYHFINIKALTPRKFIELFSMVLDPSCQQHLLEIFELNGFLPDLQIVTDKFYQFIQLFIQFGYNSKKFQEYSKLFEEYITSYFNGKTITFDVGYSCRIESIINSKFGFKIVPFYVHINTDYASIREWKQNLHINTLFDYSPAATGVVREHIISEMGPSCIGYERKDGEVVPIYEKYECNYQTRFMTEVIQNEALNFIKDIRVIFGDILDELPYRYVDAALPLEYILNMTNRRDHVIFKASKFEDDLGEGRSFYMAEFWDIQTLNVLRKSTPSGFAEGGTMNSLNIYGDGLIATFVRKVNKWFPLGSKRRDFIKKTFRQFVK